VALHQILAAPWNALLAWDVGILFIPSPALGTWTGSREACWLNYLALSCLGPTYPDSPLDLARPNGWLGGMIRSQWLSPGSQDDW